MLGLELERHPTSRTSSGQAEVIQPGQVQKSQYRVWLTVSVRLHAHLSPRLNFA